ncbi:phosphomevalonate kinase [Streptococcus merionis]|uniref:phosphomevalonate kinase n=1 Tax=Streptococcus merionis TaxID=400065 RepID=UPI0035135DDE
MNKATRTKIQAQAPGKLFIAGEYAVVDGAPAIIVAVDRYLKVTVTPTDATGSLTSSQQPDLSFSWTRQAGRIVFSQQHPFTLVVTAMQMAEDYLSDCGISVTDEVYALQIESELDDEITGQKYGLGSSGAVTVAVIRAILTYFGQPAPAMLVYKLAVLTQIKLQLKGSFGDLAASSFGGWIAYRRPDKDWLLRAMAEQTIWQITDQAWPDLQVEPLSLPAELKFLVGWTKSVASTEDLVGQMQQALSEETKLQVHQDFLAKSHSCVDGLIAGFKRGDKNAILAGLRQNRQILQAYAKQVGFVIETPALVSLMALAEEAGAASKTSGAGGGDCGICLIETPEQEAKIRLAWKRAGILPLDLTPAKPQD